MKKVYVCSPLSGDIKRNIKKAIRYTRRVVKEGHLPITPHIYFTTFLDDTKPKERAIGMKMGIELLEMCDELWVFGKVISKGMAAEILHWRKNDKGKIRFK